MRILLIQPKFSNIEVTFPLGLAYLASSLENEGHRVYGIDLAFSGFEETKKLIKRQKIDVICISSYSCAYKEVFRVCEEIKSVVDIPIVIGGPHATALAEETIKKKFVDVVVIGEGEKTIIELMDAFDKGKNLSNISGIFYKTCKRKIKRNSQRKLIKNLDSLPFPNRELFPLSFCYNETLSKNPKYAPIITSRGCVFKCSYCPTPRIWNREWRVRLAKNIVDEMEHIVEKYGIREFHIEDDNFTIDKKRVIEICNEIIKRDIDIDWQCTNGLRPDSLNSEILKKMANAGCYRIALGIESHSIRLINKFKRNLGKVEMKKLIKRIKSFGIETTGYFILGFPGEKLNSIKKTIKYSRRLGLDFAHYSIFQLIPGSEMFDLYIKAGYKWDTLLDMMLSEISKRELDNIRTNAYTSFYLNVKGLKILARNFNNRNFPVLIRKFVKYINL